MELNKLTVKKWLAFIAINLFGLIIIYLLRDFITPFFGAIIFYVLFKPFMDKLVDKYKWKENSAVLLIILLSFISVLIPIMSLTLLLYSKISVVLNDPSSLINLTHIIDTKIQNSLGFELFTDDNINEFKSKASNVIPSMLNELAWTLGNIAMMYFMLYYLLIERKKVTAEINTYLPFDKANIELLAHELKSMTHSTIIGVPAIGIIQGTAAGLGYWIFGLQEPFFWAVITAFVSILPLVGTTLIWAPAGLFLIAMGNTWPGIGLLIFGVLVIINIDNIARLMIQKKIADVHPVITIFGVIIGLGTFGLPGLVFGPLMLAYFVIFIKMYMKVYRDQP
jgi:predicted PurR-regulated permease PerM